jgi:hypothetical protein
VVIKDTMVLGHTMYARETASMEASLYKSWKRLAVFHEKKRSVVWNFNIKLGDMDDPT